MFKVIIMHHTTKLVMGNNYSAIPRIGDTVDIQAVKFKVTDVIWHFEDVTWVEIQIRGGN